MKKVSFSCRTSVISVKSRSLTFFKIWQDKCTISKNKRNIFKAKENQEVNLLFLFNLEKAGLFFVFHIFTCIRRNSIDRLKKTTIQEKGQWLTWEKMFKRLSDMFFLTHCLGIEFGILTSKACT